MISRCAEKPLVVRVAAHDSVEYDDIGRLDPLWIGCDVVKAPLHACLPFSRNKGSRGRRSDLTSALFK